MVGKSQKIYVSFFKLLHQITFKKSKRAQIKYLEPAYKKNSKMNVSRLSTKGKKRKEKKMKYILSVITYNKKKDLKRYIKNIRIEKILL